MRRSGLHRYSAGGQGIGAQGKCLRAISCRELAQQRAQLESTVDLPQPRDVGLAARELVRLHGKLEVASDRCELPRQRHVVQVLTQAFPDLALDLVAVREQRIERRVLVEPLRSGLGADLGHARDVVGGIADESEVVDDLLGVDIELCLDTGPIEPRVRHRVDERDAPVDELRHVLVAGGDHDVESGCGGVLRQRADDVVGLDPFDAQQGQAERRDRLDQRLDLCTQVILHRRTVGLVLDIEIVAKRASRRVEHDGDQGRILILEQLLQHVEYAEHGARRLAARVRQARQGVKRAVQVGRAVHQYQLARFSHGCCRACRAAARAVAAARLPAWVRAPARLHRPARAGSRRCGVSRAA